MLLAGIISNCPRGIEKPDYKDIRQCQPEWENESFWSKPIARWKYGTGQSEHLGRVRYCCAYSSQASAALTFISGVES
jgi:hypothetical protein